MATHRLLRHWEDRRVAGVCAALAGHFGWDATLVRAGWVVLTVFTGFLPGLVAYVLCALLIPEEGE